jgi:hypothetical protein
MAAFNAATQQAPVGAIKGISGSLPLALGGRVKPGHGDGRFYTRAFATVAKRSNK